MAISKLIHFRFIKSLKFVTANVTSYGSLENWLEGTKETEETNDALWERPDVICVQEARVRYKGVKNMDLPQ